MLLVAFEYFGLANYFYRSVAWVARPPRAIVVRLIQQVEWPVLTTKRAVHAAKKIQMLETRYSEALAQLTDLDELRAENLELKRLLENTDRPSREVVIAAPVVSHAGPSLGAGSVEGVEVGDLVLVAQTLVGRVSQVSPHYSQVDLIFQSDFQPVVVQTKEGYRGLVRGDGKRAILTEILPDQIPVAESRIESVGQVGVDKGIFIGQVGKLISSDSETMRTFQLIQYVDFYQASLVEIYK